MDLRSIIITAVTFALSFLGWNSTSTPRSSNPVPKSSESKVTQINLPSIKSITLTPQSAKPTPAPKPQVIDPTSAPKSTPTPVADKPTTPTSQTVESAKVEQVTKPQETFSGLEKLKRSAVNILCTMQSGNQIAYFSGSGAVIDPSGIILTNAHVAEHVLLEQAGREKCFIRIGSPASKAYKAEIVFMPSAWISNNQHNIGTIMTGTGENDYAFLKLTEIVSKTAPNIPLPYLTPDASIPNTGSSITIAGYPILSQSVSILNSGLYLLTEPSIINAVAGFDGRSSDVIDTSPTSLAEHGSSGGPIVNSSYNLIAIIDSTVTDNATGHNAIQAITLNYINRSLASRGKSIQSIIDDADKESNDFKSQIGTLSSML